MIERLNFEVEVKAAEGEGVVPGTFEGYGSVFGNTDLGGDIVLPGAFKSATARKTKLLWQHDPREPIGVWDELSEDSKGLKLKGRLALNTRRGAEAYELLKMGALDGLSIGFTMGRKDYEYDEATGVRRIKAVKLLEVSLVTFPMNTRATTTRVKSATSKRELEHLLRDAGFSRSEAKHVAGLTQLPAVDPDDEGVPALAAGDAEPSATPDGIDAADGLKAARKEAERLEAERLQAERLSKFLEELRAVNAAAQRLA